MLASVFAVICVYVCRVLGCCGVGFLRGECGESNILPLPLAASLTRWCDSSMEKTPSAIVYTAHARTTGGRAGQAVSTDPDLTLDMRMPQALGGPGGGANPEQLFAMGYGACFQGALGLAAKETGADVSGSEVAISVGLGPEGESFAIVVDIRVLIPGLPLDEAQKLVERTHQLCPYSKAVAGNVPVTVSAVEAL